MKAKTTKFLAVLAVLAMAFAGVAVLAQEQTDVADAAAQEGAAEKAEGHNVSLKIGETTTYYTTAAKAFAAVKSNEEATITLLASHAGAGLKTTSGVKSSNVTVDFAGFTYTVNNGVGSTGTETGGTQFLKENTYLLKDGTMDIAPYAGGDENKRSNVINNYSNLTLEDMVIDGTNLMSGYDWCVDPITTKEVGGMTVAVWVTFGTVNITGSTTIIAGTAGGINYGLGVDYWPKSYSDGAQVTLNTTGEINGILMALDSGTGTTNSTLTIDNAKINGDVYTYETMPLGKFVINGATIPEGKTFTANGAIQFGDNATIEMGEGSKLILAQGTSIPAGFEASFTRYIVDEYIFTNDEEVKAGVGGFTIAPGENGFELSGNIDGAPVWDFLGAASYTGIIDAKDAAVSIAADQYYDFTFKSATIYTTEGLKLTYGAAIADDAVVQINKGLTVSGGSLKVGDGAYVRVYGTLTSGAAAAQPADAVTAPIYTAGNIVVDSMKVGNNDITSDVACPGLYTYKDGSITVSNIKLTKLEKASMAYVDLTGSGQLGVNGIIVINNDLEAGGYYKYSCMVFYSVATQDVLNLKAESGIVGGIETNADLLAEPDVNLALQYAKYKINYETRTPTFVIEYKETYKVTLTNVITKYTITDSEGKPVYIASDDLSAMLIFGETYNLNGKVKDNKYTYTSSLNTGITEEEDYKQPFDYVSPVLTKFEQTRMEQTIDVTVGLAQTIYIKVLQTANDPAIAVGDLILTYSVDGEEYDVYAENLEAKLDGTNTEKFLGGTFKIYNTDRVLVKIDDKKYFFEAPTMVSGVKKATEDATKITEEELEAGWEYAVVAITPKDVQGASVLGVVTIDYSLAKVNDTFILKNFDNVSGTNKITLQFEDYYQGASGHAQTIEITPTTGNGQKSTDFYVNETYFMTWENVDGVKYKMTYPNTDPNKDPLVYNEWDVVEVVNTAENVTSVANLKGTTYTYELTKIRYADIENRTNLDLTVTYGDSEIPVKKGEKLTKENGLPLDAYYPKTATTAANLAYTDHFLVLSAKGYAISSWTGKYMKNSTEAETDATAITGSGPSSTSKLNELVDGGKIIITSIQATQNLYQVMVDDQQRPYVGEDYTRTGHYNDKMYLFPTAESGKTVYDINVYLADPTKPDLKGDLWCTAIESEDGKYSYYPMPDSDVVLEVIVDQSTYNVNFVDQDGTPVGETIPVEPYSEHTLAIPAKFGYVATDAEIVGDIEGDFEFDPETQTVTFDMPNRNVVITVTYDIGGPYSDDMEIFVSKATDGVKVTIISNDTLSIQSGYLAIRYYVLVEEDGIYGLMPVDMKPVEFATSGAGIIESMTVSLAGEESYDAIYYVSATYETLGGDVLKSDTLAYKM